jgi:hypothetical protein
MPAVGRQLGEKLEEKRCTDRWQACHAFSLDVTVEVAVSTAVTYIWLRVQGRWRAEVLDDAVSLGECLGLMAAVNSSSA